MRWRRRRVDEGIPDDLITAEEAARLYGVPAQTVRYRIDTGAWPGRRLNGGTGPRVVRRSVIDDLLSEDEDEDA